MVRRIITAGKTRLATVIISVAGYQRLRTAIRLCYRCLVAGNANPRTTVNIYHIFRHVIFGAAIDTFQVRLTLLAIVRIAEC